MFLEQLQEFLPQYLISNLIALGVMLTAWWRPFAGRISLGIIFFAASIINTYTAINNPVDYLHYSQFAVLALYRSFIDGWFAEHVQVIVLVIAFAQFLISIGMFSGGRMLKPAVVGAVVFFVAIAPLGIGSAFPCSVVLAIAAILVLRNQDPAAEVEFLQY